MNKLILISIDGMRADAAFASKNPFKNHLTSHGAYTFSERTVYPSVTLPAHLSMMYSIPPERHGTLTNHYISPVRPVDGLFEQVHRYGGKCAMFTNWVELRDIASSGSLSEQFCLSNKKLGRHTDDRIADAAKECIIRGGTDFIFVHLVETDHSGHDNGWNSVEYAAALDTALTLAGEIYDTAKDKYSVIVTADHGGHDRIHGTDVPEDMTVPFFAIGTNIQQQEFKKPVCILDVAPTAAHILGIPPCEDWEGNIILYDLSAHSH